MSSCIKHLVKKCRVCKKILLKSNFHKNKNMSDGFNQQCKFCTKVYYVDNQDRLLDKQKLYDKQNRDKINTQLKEYIRRKKETQI